MSTEEKQKQTRRLTPTSYAVLALLNQHGELSSYDIKVALELPVQQFWPIPHTVAYMEPLRLQEDGYLSSTQDEQGRHRRTYALTDAGRKALERWVADSSASAPQVRDELMLKVFAGADPAPLLNPQIDFYRDRVRELEIYMEGLSRSEATNGVRQVVRFAIRYNDSMLRLMRELAANGH